MKNRDLAKAYANGEEKGTGSNMFIDGDIIYSYGHHFPIAKEIKDLAQEDKSLFDLSKTYLFNSNEYSSSTARHKSYVRSALSEDTLIEVFDCDPEQAPQQTEANLKEIAELEGKADRAILPHMRDSHLAMIKDLQEQNVLLKSIQNEAPAD